MTIADRIPDFVHRGRIVRGVRLQADRLQVRLKPDTTYYDKSKTAPVARARSRESSTGDRIDDAMKTLVSNVVMHLVARRSFGGVELHRIQAGEQALQRCRPVRSLLIVEWFDNQPHPLGLAQTEVSARREHNVAVDGFRGVMRLPRVSSVAVPFA